MVEDLVGAALAGVSVFFGLCMLRIAALIFLGDRNEYDRNRNRVAQGASGLRTILRGEVPTKYDGVRDDKVAAGVAIDLRTNRWREQGRLSDEALRDVLAR
jgi:hypothetical protein